MTEANAETSTTVMPELLRRLAQELLVAGGAPAAEASVVAEHLVEANLKGHDSHGVGMVPTYTWSMHCGACKPGVHARLDSDRGPILVVDGGRGFGQVVGREAMELGIARARELGLAAVALRDCHHLGRIGAYAEMAVAQGLVSMHYVNVVGHPPQVAPFGGAEARLNTNPYCCGVPVAGGEPVILDMATSTVALGKVREARARGDLLDDSALIDDQGRPSGDPAVLLAPESGTPGALTCFGLHKGYGLSLICDLLGGTLAGSWPVNRDYDGPPTVYNHMLAILLDPTAVGDAEVMAQQTNSLLDYMRSTRPAADKDAVLIAGDPERESFARRSAGGVPLAAGTYRSLVELAERFGLESETVAEVRAAGQQ
ncbi:MAG: malate/lactate/ureidoglycolate dehydrogenase [Myxococcales bacterium]|nr:malate/lactate/ureidoglycolate dehydrogenase [Myxococcales bacterium]